ncbi:MAG: multicopper oxidase domain-containing protein [Rhodospirillales bacterium]
MRTSSGHPAIRHPVIGRMAIRQLAVLACFLAASLLGFGHAARAQALCEQLSALYPQPGRDGHGENAFRPLPLFSPARPQAGAPGTLSLSIAVDHVSSAPQGKPGYVYVGNYKVTDIPVFRVTGGASGVAQVVDPATGATMPIPNACLANPGWAYGGTQWGLVQADTLDVLFQSRLDYSGTAAVPASTNGSEPCRSSNLHTHGLLVSPYHPERAGLGPYGDYVLDVTQPKGSFDLGTDIDNCGNFLRDLIHIGHGLTEFPLHYNTVIPGTPHVSSLVTGEHPSGLFWYHPHPHGLSQFQEHGGTTGVITVGDLTDYACPAGDGTPGNCTITNADIRVLAIKDIGIQSYGNGLYTTIHDVESTLCSPNGGTRRGECQGIDETGGGKWVFTVNGVEYPVMHVPAGRMQIWRIVNASPSVSYRLSIEPLGHPGNGSLPFQILARDGVGVRQVHGQAEMHSQFLMMPATRIEIAIPAPPAGGAYELHNSSASMAANGNDSGNVWPSIDLARIVWGKPESASAQAAADAEATAPVTAPFDVAGQATPIPHGSADDKRLPSRCRYAVGDTRVVYFVHRFVKVFGPVAKTPSGIQGHLNEVFGLIAGLRHPDGSMDFYPQGIGKPLHSVDEVWANGVNGTDVAFPAMDHNDYNSVCTVQGNVEHWELQNWTAEDHNFHLHQSRFTIDPSGAFYFPARRPGLPENVTSTDALVKAFALQKDVPFIDTMPVPRGQSICSTAPNTAGCHGNPAVECSGAPGAAACPFPGKVSLLVDFSRAEQVGTFVYHCHVLEHEDGGMMAMITVMCRPGDTNCQAQQAAHAPICKPVATN